MFPLIGLAGRRADAPPQPAPASDEFAEVGGGGDFQEVDGAPTDGTLPGPDAGGAEASPPPAAPGGGEDFQIVMGTPAMSSKPPLERLDAVERALDESIRHMDRLDRNSETVVGDVGQVKESIARMEANMRELTSLYDLISTQMNPFVDADLATGPGGLAGPSAEEVPEYDALFEPTPEVGTEGGKTVTPEAPPLAAPGAIPAPGARPPTERATRGPRLTTIGSDPVCLMALVHWIEFMETKTRRDQIPSLLSFYVRIGWISEPIRRHVIDVARGIRPVGSAPVTVSAAATVGGYEAPKDKEGDVVMAYGKEKVHEVKSAAGSGAPSGGPPSDDWKLAHRDHMTSLIFIERIRGTEVDRERLEELERDVARLQKGLEGFFGL